jgi:hypothetical protein
MPYNVISEHAFFRSRNFNKSFDVLDFKNGFVVNIVAFFYELFSQI